VSRKQAVPAGNDYVTILTVERIASLNYRRLFPCHFVQANGRGQQWGRIWSGNAHNYAMHLTEHTVIMI